MGLKSFLCREYHFWRLDEFGKLLFFLAKKKDVCYNTHALAPTFRAAT